MSLCQNHNQSRSRTKTAIAWQNRLETARNSMTGYSLYKTLTPKVSNEEAGPLNALVFFQGGAMLASGGLLNIDSTLR